MSEPHECATRNSLCAPKRFSESSVIEQLADRGDTQRAADQEDQRDASARTA